MPTCQCGRSSGFGWTTLILVAVLALMFGGLIGYWTEVIDLTAYVAKRQQQELRQR